MTNEQHYHKVDLLERFRTAASKKYDQGQKEHGGNLWEKNVAEALMEEVQDIVVYSMTLKDQLDHIRVLALQLDHEVQAHPVSPEVLKLWIELKDKIDRFT